MRSVFASIFLLGLAFLFPATVQAAPTNETHPAALSFAVQKIALTVSTSEFISKFSAVGFDGGVDKSHIVRVRSEEFSFYDETILSGLNLTDAEFREAASCYKSCNRAIADEQSLRSDCQKLTQQNVLKGSACMCRHDGFIADIQECDDRCFPQNYTFPLEAVASTRCAEILTTEKNGAPLIGVSFLALIAASTFAVIA